MQSPAQNLWWSGWEAFRGQRRLLKPCTKTQQKPPTRWSGREFFACTCWSYVHVGQATCINLRARGPGIFRGAQYFFNLGQRGSTFFHPWTGGRGSTFSYLVRGTGGRSFCVSAVGYKRVWYIMRRKVRSYLLHHPWNRRYCAVFFEPFYRSSLV